MRDELAGVKIALAHDWLTNEAGAEKVLFVLSKMWPEAPIFTTVHDEKKTGLFQDKKVVTSKLQKWPLAKKHQLYPHLRPRAVEDLDFGGFDIVISTSSAEMKGLIAKAETMHVCYVHTPTRYYWDQYHDYFGRLEFGILNPVVKWMMPRMIHKLRMWDKLAAERPDYLVANSKNSARRIAKYYRRSSEVIYPPVETGIFKEAAEGAEKGDYFIYFGRLNPYKRPDLVVQACRALDLNLKVMGEGPEMGKLKKMAGPKTEFLGRVSDEKKVKLVAGARAFIFPALEDFGIVPVEAAAAGTPTIALRKGGSLETVKEGISGEFFEEQTALSLVAVLKDFDEGKFVKEEMQKWADQFGTEVFEKRMREFVEGKWRDWEKGMRG